MPPSNVSNINPALMSGPQNKQNKPVFYPKTATTFEPQSTSALEPAHVYVGLTTSELAPNPRFLRDTTGRDTIVKPILMTMLRKHLGVPDTPHFITAAKLFRYVMQRL